MFFWGRIRRLIREVFPPIPAPLASKWERRLRYIYIFSAWNVLGGVAYMFYRRPELAKERGGPHTSPAEYWAKAFNAHNVTFVKFVGFNPKPIIWQQGEQRPDAPVEEEKSEIFVEEQTKS